MVVTALYIENKVLVLEQRLFSFDGEVVYFLFCYFYGVFLVKTAQINMLIEIVNFVDLIEDLPGDTMFDSKRCLSELVIKNILIWSAKVRYQVVLRKFHLLVKYSIVFFTDVLVSFFLLEICHLTSILQIWSSKYLDAILLLAGLVDRFPVERGVCMHCDYFLSPPEYESFYRSGSYV